MNMENRLFPFQRKNLFQSFYLFVSVLPPAFPFFHSFRGQKLPFATLKVMEALLKWPCSLCPVTY